jgi:hypothetical protein
MKDNKLTTNKKILLLTLVGRGYNQNYGAVLQGYALQKFLTSKDYEVKILDYEANREQINRGFVQYYLRFVKALKKYSCRVFIAKLITLLPRKVKAHLMKGYESLRKRNFQKFVDQNLFFTDRSYDNYAAILQDNPKLSKDFDVFLVGSDQVWNSSSPLNWLNTYLLGFTNHPEKISYASSVSSEIPNDLVEFYKERLSKFKHISVREEESAKEIEKILGYKPKVNVDPTLLLNAEQWNEVAKQPTQLVQKPYIFVYDLYQSESILPVVEKIAKKERVKYVNYTPILFARRLRYPHLEYTFYTDGPSEFLWYLKESDFVVTSSFHGVVFSVVFRKPFYAILWGEKYKSLVKQNGRIIDLSRKLGLEDRCFDNLNEIIKRGLDTNIDWQEVHEKLNVLRKDSIEWLLRALEGGTKDGK